MKENKTGIVSKAFGLFYAVKYNNEFINCVIRGKIRQSKELKKYSDPVAVGDIVDISINDDGTGVINQILSRKNIFSRKEKGRNKKEDIIACNLDLVAIVQAFKNPRLNLRFIDRLIIRCEKEKIPVLVCINKSDLADKEIIKYINDYYYNAKIKLLLTSSVSGEGMQELKNCLSGKTSLLVGSSGVGKTSILNYLSPELNLRVSEISKSTNKGRHTTANAEMVYLSDNITIIDTPGVREFGLMDIEPHMLGYYFSEFNDYLDKCIYNPCTHDHEPECEVKKQVENGTIFKDRYVSYLNILNSLKEYYRMKYK
ncbi:MAG: ribosome small subunit-dependent GTPase A [Spirochaetota bacterium]